MSTDETPGEGHGGVDRRTVIKGLGAAGTVGAGAVLLSGTGAAQAGGEYTLSDPDAVTTDDGSILYVDKASVNLIEWSGFDREVHFVDFRTRVYVPSVGWREVLPSTDLRPVNEPGGGNADDGTEPGTSGALITGVGDISQKTLEDYAEDYENLNPTSQSTDSRWYLIIHPDAPEGTQDYWAAPDPVITDALDSNTDGGQNKTTVTVESRARLYDENANMLTGTSGFPDHPVFDDAFEVTVNNKEADVTASGEGNAGVVGEEDE